MINQGLLDRRERDGVIEALQFLRRHRVPLDPDAVMVEALQNRWGSDRPEVLRELTLQISEGASLSIRHRGRMREEGCEGWLMQSQNEVHDQ